MKTGIIIIIKMGSIKLIFTYIIIFLSLKVYSQVPLKLSDPSSSETFTSEDSYYDARDGNVYPYVQIDSCLWFTKNLAYKPEDGKFWVFRNDERTIEDFGYLYNWETALNVCPSGWDVPSKEDFYDLINGLDEQYGIGYYSLLPGGRSGLEFGSTGVKYGTTFVYIEGNTIYWTRTESAKKKAWGFSIDGKKQQVELYPTFKKESGIPVRCIKHL